MTSLYSKDSKGKIRILNISTDGADLIQESGLLGGKLVTNRKTCKAKNVGRSNEMSPENQAISEMESKIAEKLKTDYFRTIEEAETTEIILPMLAHDYKEESHRIDWSKGDVYAQPKYDGTCCLGIVEDGTVKLISRSNTDIMEEHGNSMQHIVDGLKSLPNGVYHGELYVHGLSFSENQKLIKKYRPGYSEKVKLYVYDFIQNAPYMIRRENLVKAAALTNVIELVPTQPIFSHEELLIFHKERIAEGFEGSMIRWGSAPYKINGRSNNLLKYKDFIDLALPILDIVPSDARPEWGQPIYEINGKRFSSGMRFSHEERREWLTNKDQYIGKTGELRFFEYTDDGIPRFPVTVGIRLDK